MGEIAIPGFEVLEKLGEGGLGAVYKARQLSLDRLVAIKTLPLAAGADQTYIEQFQLEAKTAATLKHPNIVQIHEAGEHKGVYYFVMEFISGYSVASWVERKGRLSESDALLVAGYVAESLEYAWNKARIVHGDVKPDNIMVDEDGTIKLSDFLAVVKPGGKRSPASLDGTVVGTPHFMSPEQVLASEKLDFHADIYSLGAVLYQLTTGVLPFQEITNGEVILEKQLSDNIPDALDRNPRLSAGIAWLIEKMMVKDPEFRYRSWSEVRMDIGRVQKGHLPLEPFPTEGMSTMRRTESRRIPPTVTPQVVEDETAADERPRPTGPVSETADVVEGEKWLYVLVGILVVLAGAYMAGFRLPFGAEPESEILEEPVEMESVTEADELRPMLEVVSAPGPLVTAAREKPSLAAEEPADDTAKVTSAEEEPLPSAEEETSGTADDEVRIQGLMEYVSLMEGAMRLVRLRRYEEAVETLQLWKQNRDEHPYAEQVVLEIERITRLPGIFVLLERNVAKIRGIPVRARTNLSGKVDKIRNGVVTLIRETAGGQAAFQVSIHHIYERDLAELLKHADPEGCQRNLAILQIGKLQFEAARDLLREAKGTPEHILFVQAWIADWQNVVFNLRANQALAEISQLVESLQLQRAQAKLDAAEITYGLTDVFSWARKKDVDDLRMAIEAGLSTAEAAGVELTSGGSSPFGTSDPEALSDDWEEQDEEESDEEATTAGDQRAVQITVQELSQKLITYDKQLVKLSFHARGDIQQRDETTYTSQLGSHGIFFPAEFSQDGFKWVQNIPKWSGRRRRTVYGVVDAANRRITLIGRTKITPLGRQSVEYSW